MECDQCGARRPRTGPCPECGAPPPQSYSSLRQWRDQSRSGKGPAVRGRGSGTNWNTGGPGTRGRGSGADWRTGRQADEWDDGAGYDGYDDPPPPRSGARNARRAPDYEEVDLERALVPSYEDMLPMQQQGMMGAVALPGMPATDEEERALGIRRPVYIPATGDKRKRKLGTWRVVSGVLSIMLVCIASCSLAGILGRNRLNIIFGPPQHSGSLFGSVIPTVPLTPAPTLGPQAKYVKNVVTATGVDSNYVPINTTTHFAVNSDVYVVASVRGITKGQQHVISIRWFLGGTDLGLTSVNNLSKPIDKDSNVYFSLRYPTPGLGTAKVYFDRPSNDSADDTSYLAATINFAVEMPTTPTTKGGSPTPGTSPTSGSKTPTPSPKGSIGAPPVAWRTDGGAA